MQSASLLGATVFAAFVAGCGGSDNDLYTVPQVKEAFERSGISLLDQGLGARPDILLFASYRYDVVAATATDAEIFWTDGSLGEPIARRGNVIVRRVLGTPTRGEKEKIRAALEALPDSDHSVVFAKE